MASTPVPIQWGLLTSDMNSTSSWLQLCMLMQISTPEFYNQNMHDVANLLIDGSISNETVIQLQSVIYRYTGNDRANLTLMGEKLKAKLDTLPGDPDYQRVY